MSSADWWARKLAAQGRPATAPPQAPTQQPSYPHTGPTPPPAPLPHGAQQEIVVTKDNLVEAAAQWKGGEATRKETQHCPDCGSNNFFSNSSSGPGSRVFTQGGAMPVAPRCFDCGYNTSFGKQTGAM